MKEILKSLKIPFDKQFYNLPIAHYNDLISELGFGKVNGLLRDLLVNYKTNQPQAEKVRKLIRALDKTAPEKLKLANNECECGFITQSGEDYTKCPICSKRIYKNDKVCYYKTKDGDCSITDKECKFFPNECSILKEL